MNELVGQTFALDGKSYRIVDVYYVEHDVMVHAEDLGVEDNLKTAFHLHDIEARIKSQLRDAPAD